MATAQQMLNCSIDHWYSTFQTVSFRSQIVPLPADFVNYLVEDGVYLPDNTLAVDSITTVTEALSTQMPVQTLGRRCSCPSGLPLI